MTPRLISPLGDSKLDTVQLYDPRSKIAHVFHVRQWRGPPNAPVPVDGGVPPHLLKLLESESLRKACVNATSDIGCIQRTWPDHEVKAGGFVDPGFLANYLGVAPRKNVSLNLLSRPLLKKSVDKTFQMSNWARKTLSRGREQQKYAALDAVLHYEVHHHLEGLIDFIEKKPAAGGAIVVSMPSKRHHIVLRGSVVAVDDAAATVAVMVSEVKMPGFMLRHHSCRSLQNVAAGKTSGFLVNVDVNQIRQQSNA